jgi:hypothetical protein
MFETSIDRIIDDQYWLSRRANISVSESNEMAEFERLFFVSLLLRDIKEERESYEGLSN